MAELLGQLANLLVVWGLRRLLVGLVPKLRPGLEKLEPSFAVLLVPSGGETRLAEELQADRPHDANEAAHVR